MRLIRKFRRFLINVFGFSKTETNGFLVLIILVFASAIVPRVYFRFYRPEFKTSQPLSEWVAEMERSIALKEKEAKIENLRVRSKASFDPNNAPFELLKDVGIPDRIANRIVNYRSKGGKFREVEDLKKIYGFPSQLFEELRHQINIEKNVEMEREMASEVPRQFHVEEDISFDLNTATAEELKKVKGVGEVLSNRIIRYRDLLGGFQDIIQLNEVYGLKPEVIHEIGLHAKLEGSIETLSINKVDSIKHLAIHPYIDYNLARAIINFRAVHGEYQSLEDLQKIKVLDDSLYHKIAPYLSL